MLQTLRQPRYLGLFGLMLVLTCVCGVAGTWQVYRYEQTHAANDHLRANDRSPAQNVAAVLGPATDPISNGQTQKFRHVTATGTFLASRQTLLRGQTLDNNVGYLVMTPLKTADGVLLVARGFIQQNNVADVSPAAPSPPAGTVTVTVRLQPADQNADRFGQLPGVQVDGINPAEQAARIGSPVWNGYAELLAGQPGGSGLQTIPAPDMTNPAGGAEEPQHLAYVVQWYLFGLLALSAPFILASAERRRDEDPETPANRKRAASTPAQDRKTRKASLDDRLAGRA